MRATRCSSCRWWDRSHNFNSKDRDWGDCRFWGAREGLRHGRTFVDHWRGPSPRGSDTCVAHNAPPEKIGKIDPRSGPSNPRGDE